MFKKNYKKKLQKLIDKKISIIGTMERLTLNYRKNPMHSEEKADSVMRFIAEISKEIIACQTEREFTKETYEKHINNFHQIAEKEGGRF